MKAHDSPRYHNPPPPLTLPSQFFRSYFCTCDCGSRKLFPDTCNMSSGTRYLHGPHENLLVRPLSPRRAMTKASVRQIATAAGSVYNSLRTSKQTERSPASRTTSEQRGGGDWTRCFIVPSSLLGSVYSSKAEYVSLLSLAV